MWGVKNKNGTSKLWQTIQHIKGTIKLDLRWEIGDGKSIGAMNQPWFDQWQPQQISSNAQRDIKIADLFDTNIGTVSVII